MIDKLQGNILQMFWYHANIWTAFLQLKLPHIFLWHLGKQFMHKKLWTIFDNMWHILVKSHSQKPMTAAVIKMQYLPFCLYQIYKIANLLRMEFFLEIYTWMGWIQIVYFSLYPLDIYSWISWFQNMLSFWLPLTKLPQQALLP